MPPWAISRQVRVGMLTPEAISDPTHRFFTSRRDGFAGL